MTDPAIKAARRATARYGPQGMIEVVAAAREMAKPIRDLHRRVEISATSCMEECEIHEDECPLDARVPVCWECYQVAETAYPYFSESAGWDLPVGWPCDTAKLIYTAEELER